VPSNLENFDLIATLRCSNALRRLLSEAKSMEAAAAACCKFLYEELTDARGERACALVRCYKVHDFGLLPPDVQAFARAQLPPGETAGPQLRCLTLMATVGDEPEWNDRRLSKGHQAIALPTEAVVERAPMIAQLFRAFGVELRAAISPAPTIVRELAGRSYGVFYVPEAAGSQYIPAQDFVAKYKIRSVLGFGGSLLSGDLFAIVLFTRVHVPEESADRFRSLALDVKSHLFLHTRTFDR
jgi:hypothetical protein